MSTLTIEISDWSRSQVAELAGIPADTTVGALREEAREALALAGEHYHLLFDGEKLDPAITLEELGVRSGDELTIAPEVSAG